MEEGEQVEKCIICLESKPIKGCLKNDNIIHIPCTCNAYVHEYCFYKTNNVNKCFICKNKYIYNFGHHPENKPCCKKVDCNYTQQILLMIVVICYWLYFILY